MKIGINLQLNQQLALTPQLQQAIRLLQLSTLELQAELQEQLANNPFLENIAEAQESLPPLHTTTVSNQTTTEKSDFDTKNPQEEYRELGTMWSFDDASSHHKSNSFDNEDFDFTDFLSDELTLQDHLVRQMQLTTFTEIERMIALTIIDAIDEHGMLATPLEELMSAVNVHQGEEPVDITEMEAVLKRIQYFEPPGIAARDLRECLLLQMQQLPMHIPCRELAIKIVSEHLHWLGSHELKRIQRHYNLTEESLQEVIKLIRYLNPRPGNTLSPTIADYIIPDLLVKKIKSRYVAILNTNVLPKVQLNTHYVQLIKSVNDQAQAQQARGQIQEARWLLKSIKSRNETMLKVAQSIVTHQYEFFKHGPEALRPLVLNDIAIAVNLHESTISRVTTNKYIDTPHGIFELKYFFSSHVSTADGNEFSAKAIQAIIKKLITQENVRKPLSDDKIAKALEEQGFQVARRTVAKYREGLNIPASSARKRLA